MTIVGMDDLAAVSMTETLPTLTWETAADWDAAVSESGVVHESTPNTDHTDATVVKQGYPVANPLFATDLVGYWPLHEDAGTTANDFSGNANDGTITGATLGATGILGTSAYSFDGVDDYVSLPNFGSDWTELSLLGFFRCDDDGREQRHSITAQKPNLSLRMHAGGTIDNLRVIVNGSVDNGDLTVSTDLSALNHICVTVAENGTMRVYVNGAEVGSDPVGSFATWSGENNIGRNRDGSGNYYTGMAAGYTVVNRQISGSEVQQHYDIAATAGQLVTATKQFSTATTPDLQNLDYVLNGQSIDLSVIGSPGTADEEINTVTLDGGTSYTLSWVSSHQDFRVNPDISTTDKTTTATINRVELVE